MNIIEAESLIRLRNTISNYFNKHTWLLPYVLLTYIDKYGIHTAKELAPRLGISPSAVSQSLKKLMVKGYLDEAPNTDKRSKVLKTNKKTTKYLRIIGKKFLRSKPLKLNN